MFYFVPPIKKLFVDDDIKQLDALKSLFNDEDNMFFNNADKVVEEIQRINQCYEKFNSMVSQGFGEELVKKLLPHLRKKEVAVVVADYDLKAQVNGLDLLKNISNKYVIRILCTGVVDEKQANNAFNNKQIENYFQKSDTPEKLIHFMAEAVQDYYERINNNIQIKLVSLIEDESPLRDADFHSFFKDLILVNKIQCYCVLDFNGSYFLIDTAGQEYTLFVVSDGTIDAQIEILEENKLDFWIDDIKNKKRFLYIHNDYPKYEKLIFNCSKLSDYKNYSYSLIKGNPLSL
jgi:CheY-like chemotaxis protein